MKRTKDKTVNMFKETAVHYENKAEQTNDEEERLEAAATTEAYEMAAFQLIHDTKRTKDELAELFKSYAYEYDKIAAHIAFGCVTAKQWSNSEAKYIKAAAKREAFENVAFEIIHNME